MQGTGRDLGRTENSGVAPDENVGDERGDSGVRYVDAREAARMLDISQREVRQLTARGRLRMKTEGVAERLMVSESSVKKLRSELERAR